MPRRARNVPSSRLTPNLLARFDELLYTWDLRQVRGEVNVQAPRTAKNWQHACEEEYGDGQYDERRDSLRSTLKKVERLRPHADFEVIFTVLAAARHAEIVARLAARAMDRTRELEAERKSVLRKLQKALPVALALCDAMGYADPFRWTSGTLPPLVHHLEHLRDALDPRRVRGLIAALDEGRSPTDDQLKALNILTLPIGRPGSRLRRPEAHRPRRVWLDIARKGLANADVPTRLGERLLRATGLLPYSEES
jgi:hypothetical protein